MRKLGAALRFLMSRHAWDAGVCGLASRSAPEFFCAICAETFKAMVYWAQHIWQLALQNTSQQMTHLKPKPHQNQSWGSRGLILNH
jgi:hypothetical protein